jgi:hypothetical protein
MDKEVIHDVGGLLNVEVSEEIVEYIYCMKEISRSIFDKIKTHLNLEKLRGAFRKLFTGKESPQIQSQIEPESKPEPEEDKLNQAPPFSEEEIISRLKVMTKENNERELSIEEQQVVIDNARKLYFDFIDREYHSDISGLGGGDRIIISPGEEDSGIRQYLTITYNSDSGKIEKRPREFEDGDYSIFRTNVNIYRFNMVHSQDGKAWETDWSQHPSFTIETEYPEGVMSAVEWTQALEEGVTEDEEGRLVANAEFKPLKQRTIRPERLFPDLESNQQGEVVYSLQKFTPEDRLVLKSLEIFNSFYGAANYLE